MRHAVTIRRARLSDAPGLSRLLALTWRKAFGDLLSARSMREVSRRWHGAPHLEGQIRDPKCYFGVAQSPRGRILGLTTVRRTSPTAAFMHRLYVRPGCQGLGLGETLLEAGWAAFPGLRRMRLEVLAGNAKALAFYRKHGFRKMGRKRVPVLDEALDLRVMEKRLTVRRSSRG